jgi:tRNA(fMet)-specific endonuclease VapC
VTHLLDMNTCVEFLRKGAASKVAARLRAALPGSVVLCSVVVGELLYGAWRSSNPVTTRAQVLAFTSQLVSLPFDDLAAEPYGQIRAHLASIGPLIGPYDLQIAAIARANGLRVVTHNTNEFSRVHGLVIEDWLK